MDGVVLNFDAESSSGLIRASDGKRYRFAPTDWASPGAARQGDLVDFEPLDERATEIFVTKRVPISEVAVDALSDLTEELRLRVSGRQNGPNPPHLAIKDTASLIAATLILLASFLPFVTLPPVPLVGFEGGGYNLYSSVMKVSAGIGVLGTFAPGSVSVPLRLIYLLFAIPAAAGYLLTRELAGTADSYLRFRTGLLAVLGPIGIPVFALLLAVTLNGGGELLGNIAGNADAGVADKGFSAISGLFGIGLMLTMAAGVALLATSQGWNPIKALVGSFVYLLLLSFSADYGALSALTVGIGGGALLLAVLQGWSLFDQMGVKAGDADSWPDETVANTQTQPAKPQFCGQCGHSNDSNDRFCASCGTEI